MALMSHHKDSRGDVSLHHVVANLTGEVELNDKKSDLFEISLSFVTAKLVRRIMNINMAWPGLLFPRGIV